MKNKVLSYLFKTCLVFGVWGTIFAGIDIYQAYKKHEESENVEVVLSRQEIKTCRYSSKPPGARSRTKKYKCLKLFVYHNEKEIEVSRLKTGGFNSESGFKWGMSEEVDWDKIKNTYPVGKVFNAYYHPIKGKLYLEKGDIFSSILLAIASLCLLIIAGLIEVFFKPKD